MTERPRKPAPQPARPRTTSPASAPRRRGRPLKFGRPSQVIALTLPDEVLGALRTVHQDPAWAIVQLVEQMLGTGGTRRHVRQAVPVAELVHFPGRRALIVVQPKAFANLRGVSTIPLADGRAFLALDGSGGVADLELAILDRIDDLPAESEQRRQLLVMRELVRSWRRDPELTFRTPHIIVIEGRANPVASGLAPLGRAV